jgi:hypothetical protein
MALKVDLVVSLGNMQGWKGTQERASIRNDKSSLSILTGVTLASVYLFAEYCIVEYYTAEPGRSSP